MAPTAISPIRTSLVEDQQNGYMPVMNVERQNGHSPKSSIFAKTSTEDLFDLICIGFGPASLAIAIALHDACKASPSTPPPKVLFLEKQPQFAWHAGMQLSGAKMQISFLKDLATPRDPTSSFTFINYLHQNGRLNHFINLGTFLPSRAEYEDYLRWCASHFSECVQYGSEVAGVEVNSTDASGKVASFSVVSQNATGHLETYRSRHIIIAVGGRPVLPPMLQQIKHVMHSSQYQTTISQIAEREQGRKLRFAVVGGGQSAAEIFNDLWTRFPDAEVRLIVKGASLRPSDDSPFVNEIFDPDRVDGIYSQDPEERAAALTLDRGTNYGVVRLTLLEHLYDQLYHQRLREPDANKWRCQILNQRRIVSATQGVNGEVVMQLVGKTGEETLTADYVFAATGYQRNSHREILASLDPLLPAGKEMRVSRQYQVLYDEEKVDRNAGIWLQGCNESTHGLSDTLLSILAIRGGELVQSIFGVASEGVCKAK